MATYLIICVRDFQFLSFRFLNYSKLSLLDSSLSLVLSKHKEIHENRSERGPNRSKSVERSTYGYLWLLLVKVWPLTLDIIFFMGCRKDHHFSLSYSSCFAFFSSIYTSNGINFFTKCLDEVSRKKYGPILYLVVVCSLSYNLPKFAWKHVSRLFSGSRI